MKNLKKGCHALIVALIMAIFCNFIAFGDEVAEPESAVESVMDDTADASAPESTDSETDDAAEPDSDSETDGSDVEGQEGRRSVIFRFRQKRRPLVI